MSTPVVATVMASPLIFGRIFNILLDQSVIEDSGESQAERTFVILTSALTPQIAKVKARLFTLGLRPKRKIVDIEIGVLEEGIFLKRYQLTIRTELMKQKDTEESVE